MNKRILLTISILVFITIFYFLFPKYKFLTNNAYVMRCNTITGKIDYFNFIQEFYKQHPKLDLQPIIKLNSPFTQEELNNQ